MEVTDPNRDLFSCVRGEHGARRRNPLASIAKARAQRRLVSSSVTECNGRRIETRHRRSRVALAEVTQVRQRRRREPTNDRRRLRSSPGQARIFGEREHAGAR